MDFSNILKRKYISYVISIILGIGLSSLFKKTCKTHNCVVRVGPKPENILNQSFKHNNKCYEFAHESKPCNSAKKIIKFA